MEITVNRIQYCSILSYFSCNCLSQLRFPLFSSNELDAAPKPLQRIVDRQNKCAHTPHFVIKVDCTVDSVGSRKASVAHYRLCTLEYIILPQCFTTKYC